MVYTDPQGRKRPITPPKPKHRGLTIGVAATLVVGGVSAGGVGVTASRGAAAADSVTVSQSLSTRTTQARRSARNGRYDQAWLRMGLRQVARHARHDAECGTHSSGQVQDCLLLRTPCRSMQRALVVLSDEHGNTMAVSIAWVWMPDSSSARHLLRLLDTPGTGNISPLPVDVVAQGKVRFTGRHHGSRRAGSLVVVAKAAPASGRPDPAVLDGVAEVAAEFPYPVG